ncbi:aspartate/glutamate racemase family protein [Candidatus Bathyarchaeota archaeon]|nr:aspartate/glutamate racemase family protein [Candidatus Bathyarchaeota archaeon]
MEPEFYRMLPKGFSVHTARLRLGEVTVEGLTRMEERVEEEAEKLADASVEIIGYGCTSGSLLRGKGHEELIEERIRRASGVPAVATAGAVVRALRALGVRRVAVATPYIDEINLLEERFLTQHGFEVVNMVGLGLKDNLMIGRLSKGDVERLVERLRLEEVEGIFISCTNLPTTELIGELERRHKRPVISSNTATLWAMLRECSHRVEIRGYGTLLENPP